MNRLSDGFMDALDSDFEHAVEGLKIYTKSPGLDRLDQDLSLAQLNDFSEMIRDHNSKQPLIPTSNLGFPRVKTIVHLPDHALRRGSLMDESVGSSAIVMEKKQRGKQVTREYDLSSFAADNWTLAKGWKNRPRRGKVFGKSHQNSDIAAFKKRFEDAREKGDNLRGFRFGYHSSPVKFRGSSPPPPSRGGSAAAMGSTSESLLLRKSSSLASLLHDPSYVGSLRAEQKIETIKKFHLVDNSLIMGEKYNPTDIQEILHRNLRSVRDETVGLRMASPAGTRNGPQGRPILVPRAGSPLEKARTITFGTCRRFAYDPHLLKSQ